MKDIAIVDPYPRTMELIFSKTKLIELKNKFKLIFAPKTNKQKFYINNRIFAMNFRFNLLPNNTNNFMGFYF